MNKKVKIGVLVVIIAIFLVGIGIYSQMDDMDDIKYVFSSNMIDIQSIDLISSEYVGENYNGTSKSYKVIFTPIEDLDNVTIEVFAYTKNDTPLDVMANFFGFNSLNTLMYQENAVKGQSLDAHVTFGQKGHSDFDVAYLKVFVYENKGGNSTLVSKFTYNIPE